MNQTEELLEILIEKVVLLALVQLGGSRINPSQ